LLLPLSVLGSALLDFSVSATVLAVMMASYGITPTVALLLLPVWLILLFMLGSGLGIAAAALSVRYRDIQYMVPVLVQMLLYASPVAYSLSSVPTSLQPIVAINPLTGLLEAFRWSVLGSGDLPLGYLAWSAVASVLSLIVGVLVFASMDREFADVI
jgi:lipopolysaccharide transport system permease protein